jgi:hypothetical protein
MCFVYFKSLGFFYVHKCNNASGGECLTFFSLVTTLYRNQPSSTWIFPLCNWLHPALCIAAGGHHFWNSSLQVQLFTFCLALRHCSLAPWISTLYRLVCLFWLEVFTCGITGCRILVPAWESLFDWQLSLFRLRYLRVLPSPHVHKRPAPRPC